MTSHVGIIHKGRMFFPGERRKGIPDYIMFKDTTMGLQYKTIQNLKAKAIQMLRELFEGNELMMAVLLFYLS